MHGPYETLNTSKKGRLEYVRFSLFSKKKLLKPYLGAVVFIAFILLIGQNRRGIFKLEEYVYGFSGLLFLLLFCGAMSYVHTFKRKEPLYLNDHGIKVNSDKLIPYNKIERIHLVSYRLIVFLYKNDSNDTLFKTVPVYNDDEEKSREIEDIVRQNGLGEKIFRYSDIMDCQFWKGS